MTKLQALLAAGCRTDGITFAPDGTPTFVTTAAGGAWTTAEQNAALAALGLAPLTLTSAQQQAH